MKITKKNIILTLLIVLLVVLSVVSYKYYVANHSFNYIKKYSVMRTNDIVVKKIVGKFFSKTLSKKDIALYDKKIFDKKLTQEERDFLSFEKSKLLGMYGERSEKFTIINKLVNASTTNKSIKSASAYDILHTYFEDGDLNKVLTAIAKSPYMSKYTAVLEQKRNPFVHKNLLGMTTAEKDLLFMSYLDAAANFEQSLAITATAADMYAEYYQTIKPLVDKKISDTFIQTSLKNFDRSIVILEKIEAGKYRLPANDIVVGLNHMAGALQRYEKENIQHSGNYSIDKIYEDSVKLAKESAPDLYVYTTYLQSIYLSNKEKPTRQDISRIKSNLSFIYSGDLSPTSFARRFIEAKNFSNEIFGKAPVAKLANIDNGLKIFLLKNGWTEEDFQ